DGKDHFKLFIGYLVGAAVMIAGGLVAAVLGVDAEGRSLEDIAAPLSAVKSRVSESMTGLTSGVSSTLDQSGRPRRAT
ncbi:MAG: hypothetical protein QOD91_588, partial [Frankiales bacterium]|nr:hypothetical protein [Frankiales bacterium]